MVSMLYGFAYTPRALTYLKMLQPKMRRQILKQIEALSNDPWPRNSRIVHTKTHGDHKVHRIRSGDYRVLYFVRENQVVIFDIDHRKDIYRRMK